MGDYENRSRCRQLSTLLPLVHLILAVCKRVSSFLEPLERSHSIRTGAIDAGSSVGSGMASGEDSTADVISSGNCRHSRSLKAKGLTKTVSPPCSSSIV